jgi:TRAP-type C4-dicarboxylate transport system permease small subunit
METNSRVMNPKQESLIHLAICLLMILLSLGGLAYGVVSGLILARDAIVTMDGILLVLICLSLAGTFAALLLNLAVREGWVGRKKAKSDEKAASDGEKSA